MPSTSDIDVREATFEGFQAVMGEKGGCGGCWCMLWRLPKKQMDAQMGEGNRLAMRAVFEAGEVPGLVAHADGVPIGWIQVAPRAAFPRLENSRVLKPVDDQEVWSVACFLVDRAHRRQGVALALLNAACDFAGQAGGRILEGYPVEPRKSPYPPLYAWTGFAATFRAAGFEEVARRSETRPIMRKRLD
ncbi:MAG: GNAT family N-acetyltransferase [Alphaproteobacteria bacterium]|jgi:GNAT superfamily N-acetyltransferase|nr:GNAT family N-acetyltransferase [Alphaproteobacteria bacterium]MDP6813217.1 GNAT family N-acetyltransferase [Alphaproteobacteria bacterium]